MEIVKFILYFLTNLFVSYGIFYSYEIINSKQGRNFDLRTNILIIIMSLIIVTNNLYMIKTLKVLVAFLTTALLCKILYKDSIKNALFTTLFVTIISIFLEIMLSIILGIFVPNVNTLNNSMILKISFTIVHTIILITLMKYSNISIWINKIKIFISNYINFFTISLIITMGLNLFIYFRAENFDEIGIFIILTITILIVIIFVRVLIIDKYNNKLLEEKNKYLEKSYDVYAQINEENRTLKHNLNSDLYSLQTSLPEDKQKLVQILLKKYNKKEIIEDYDYIPEDLQGLIFIKQKEAEAQKIKINVRCNKKFDIEIDEYLDLCNILNILLDNAIEASKNIKYKIIEIDIKERKNNIEIIILNKFNNRIDINNISKRNYSTKEIKSGIGLNYIKNLTNKRIKVNLKIINDLFIAKLVYKVNTNA